MYIDTKSSVTLENAEISILTFYGPRASQNNWPTETADSTKKFACSICLQVTYYPTKKNLPITLKIAHQKSNSHISTIMKTATAENSPKKIFYFKTFYNLIK